MATTEALYSTHLLPSLDVVAVSQAPSPESNPNFPLPVKAIGGQYPPIQSYNREERVIESVICSQTRRVSNRLTQTLNVPDRAET